MLSVTSIDLRELRNALGAFATGVTVVTTCDAIGRDIGLTASSFNSVSLEPPMVLWSLSKTSGSFAAFSDATHFAVHILASDQEALSNRFATKSADKFAGLASERNEAGVPLLSGCTARFQCRTAYRYEGGDHLIFVGEVLAFDHIDKPPLVFHGGRYALARAKPVAAAVPADGEFGDGTSLGSLLTRTYLRMVGPLRLNTKRLGLTQPQRYMLNVLMAGAPLDIAAINDLIGYSGMLITSEAAQALVEQKLICRDETPAEDAQFRLTKEGRRLTIELMSAAKAVEIDALASLTEAEQHLLRDLLSRLVGGMIARTDERATRHLDLVQAATLAARADS